VVNDTIFACNIYNPPGTIAVIDARNKDNLATITTWENAPSPGPHNIALSLDRKTAYVTDEIGGNPRLLKIWDITNLNNVIKLAEWQPTGITTSIIHNVELYGKYLFAAHYTAGLRVVDVSNPSNPVEAAWYDTYPADNGFTYDGCWGPYIFKTEKIIASDRQTGLYVFRTSFPLKDPEPPPGEFSLGQNFPNPFNPVTAMWYTLKFESDVSIKLYDVTGRQVAVILDRFMPAGRTFAIFDGSNFSSGVYFARMVAKYNDGGEKIFTQSRKMVFIK
jgi:hypothetical protein